MAKAVSHAPSPSDLYERDYYAWIQAQVRALRKHRTGEIDWANVAEEIEDLGKSEKRSVERQLARIVEHLLKLSYTPPRMRSLNRRGWQASVREGRHQIQKLLRDSPSLHGKIPEFFRDAYASGRNGVIVATNLSESALPEICPWSLEQVLDQGFLPAISRKA
jgi:hypothetical protein